MSRDGTEFAFNLTGNKGLAGIAVSVIAVLFIGIRAMTLGESDDERLRAVVKAELVTKMSGDASHALEQLDTSDAEAIDAFLETVDAENIQIHSISVSRPLLSMSSNETVVVNVDYTLPGGARTGEYWRMRYSVATGWRHVGRGTGLGYYLNFL